MKEFKNKLQIWEESLASLDESLFLILAANFIGKVPTPFHRPQIIKRLTTLFSNDLFVKRVEDSLTLTDRQILTVTAPSKRLNNWSPNHNFRKTTMGITIAEAIGIQKMRDNCPLFNAWLKEIEKIKNIL